MMAPTAVATAQTTINSTACVGTTMGTTTSRMEGTVTTTSIGTTTLKAMCPRVGAAHATALLDASSHIKASRSLHTASHVWTTSQLEAAAALKSAAHLQAAACLETPQRGQALLSTSESYFLSRP